jgi:hypothetical protein
MFIFKSLPISRLFFIAMKYNPITRQLYTDSGMFLKKLHCPLSKQWEELNATNFLKGKMCDQCNKTVYDTSLFSDEQLSELVKNDAHACLKIDLNQPNLTITYTHNE